MKIKLINNHNGIVSVENKYGIFDSFPSALLCSHHLNRTNYYEYFLPCRLLHITKSGKAKVEVLSQNGKQYVRYVENERIWKKEGSHENDS